MPDQKTKREPYRRVLSENIAVVYGFIDGHAVVKARLPVPLRPWYSVQVKAETLKLFQMTFKGALDFGEGKSSLALVDPIEIHVREDCKVRWGFPDRHLELSLKRFGIWLPPFSITLEELKTGHEALNEACLWADLPADVRELQGAKS
jgi:hypothetical protein